MISTHVLDLNLGQPGTGIKVRLEKSNGQTWAALAAASTNPDGRIAFAVSNEAGVYRLTFELSKYFKAKQIDAFFPEATVVFDIKDTNRKYHIPLLLSPFGYSTYRGS